VYSSYINVVYLCSTQVHILKLVEVLYLQVEMNSSEVKSISQMKDLCGRDVLSCILGLSDIETRIFSLLKEEELPVTEIAEKVDRDRSTVQRIVKNLISTGVVTRRSVSLKKGRRYEYTAVPVTEVKKKLMRELDQFYLKTKEQIELLDQQHGR